MRSCEGGLPQTDDRVLEVTSLKGIAEAFAACTEMESVSTSFKNALVYTQLSHPGDEDVFCYRKAGGTHGLEEYRKRSHV